MNTNRYCTPTPELTCEAVAQMFNCPLHAITNNSRRGESYLPFIAYIHLLRVRSRMSAEEIINHTGLHKRKVYRALERAHDLIRLDYAFNMKIMMSELLIIQQSMIAKGLPAVMIIA